MAHMTAMGHCAEASEGSRGPSKIVQQRGWPPTCCMYVTAIKTRVKSWFIARASSFDSKCEAGARVSSSDDARVSSLVCFGISRRH